MTLERVLELQREQLERYRVLKMSCATCIDDEVIEAQEIVIDMIENIKDMYGDHYKMDDKSGSDSK